MTEEIKTHQHNDFEPAESKLQVHQFQDIINENLKVVFYIVSFAKHVLVWVGNTTPQFDSLLLSLSTRYDSVPLTANLMGGLHEEYIQGLSKRLAMKAKKPVYLSFNLNLNELQRNAVQKKLIERLKQIEIFE